MGINDVKTAPGWFDINSVDRDNLEFHLCNTPAQEAWLGEALSEAARSMDLLDLEANTLEATLFVEYKSKPLERITTKHGRSEVDCTDEMAKMLSRQDPRVKELRRRAIEWQSQLNKLRGYQAAFKTKKIFLASLAGWTREEMKNLAGGG